MKQYKFKSEAQLKDFTKNINPDHYKVEGNEVNISVSNDALDEMGYTLQYLIYDVEYLRSENNYLYGLIGEHMNNGHLPPIEGAGKLEAALKTLGMDKDYEVVKKPLFAADKHGNILLELSTDKK